MAVVDWMIVGVFLFALIFIGWLFSKKSKDIGDYFVAGRAMPDGKH